MICTAVYIMSNKSTFIYCLLRAINLCRVTQSITLRPAVSLHHALANNVNTSISFMDMNVHQRHRQRGSKRASGANLKFKSRWHLFSLCGVFGGFFSFLFFSPISFLFTPSPLSRTVISRSVLSWLVRACSTELERLIVRTSSSHLSVWSWNLETGKSSVG